VLAVLLTLAGGLREALTWPGRAPRYLLGLVGVGLLLAPIGLNLTLAWQVVPAVALAGILVTARRRFIQRSLPLAIAGLSVLSAWPVLWDMRDDWQVHDAEHWLLNDADMKLWDASGWRVDRVFQQELAARPARNSHWRYPNEASWNGYLNGQFLMRDADGAILRERRAVERLPELTSFMQQASRLVAVPCRAGACDGGSDVWIPLPQTGSESLAGFSWQPLLYSRSLVRYRVVLPETALVVENELYARGWRAKLDHAALLPSVRVNDALRGWVLPAGEHDMELTFETPLLDLGVGVSLAALLVYGLVLVLVIRTRRLRRMGNLSRSNAESLITNTHLTRLHWQPDVDGRGSHQPEGSPPSTAVGSAGSLLEPHTDRIGRGNPAPD
jgi:hypothetical protein